MESQGEEGKDGAFKHPELQPGKRASSALAGKQASAPLPVVRPQAYDAAMYRLPAPELPDWLERMLPFQRYCLNSGRHRMHVMETGRGFPVLMLHGSPAWGFLYRRIAVELAGSGLRAIMPDLVGFGFSDKPADAGEHTLEKHAGHIRSLVEGLELQRLILVLHDWGGPIGLEALAGLPGRLEGLVVLNSILAPPGPGHPPPLFNRFSHLPVLSQLAFRVLGFPQNALARVQHNPHSIEGEVARAYRYPLRRIRDRTGPLALARMVPSGRYHPSFGGLERSRSFLLNFKGPAAIAWGRHDPLLKDRLAELEALLPQARTVRLPAGHYPQEETPQEIARAVLMIFDGLPPL